MTSPGRQLWCERDPAWFFVLIALAVGLSAGAVPFLPAPEASRSASGPAEPPPLRIGEISPSPSPEPAVVSPTPSATFTVLPTSEPTRPPTSPPASPASGAPENPSKERKKRPQPSAESFTPIEVAAAAESNEVFGGAARIACTTCASGSRVQYIAGGAGVAVPLPKISVAGKRRLTITYETVGPRELYIEVNGEHRQMRTVDGESWDSPGRVTLDIELRKGPNVLRFSNPQGPAPDLDRFRIS